MVGTCWDRSRLSSVLREYDSSSRGHASSSLMVCRNMMHSTTVSGLRESCKEEMKEYIIFLQNVMLLETLSYAHYCVTSSLYDMIKVIMCALNFED